MVSKEIDKNSYITEQNFQKQPFQDFETNQQQTSWEAFLYEKLLSLSDCERESSFLPGSTPYSPPLPGQGEPWKPAALVLEMDSWLDLEQRVETDAP